MSTKQDVPKTIDQYIASFPQDVQEVLQKIRTTVRKVAPDAEETIKYGMPTFTLKGNLVYFAAFKNAYWLLSSDLERKCDIQEGAGCL